MCTRTTVLLIFLLTGLAFFANAQQRLDMDLSNRCIFDPQGQEEELYAFPTEAKEAPELVFDILARAGNVEKNFSLVQANVENVSAVVVGDKRYLLWSQDFWENATPLLRYAAFAHEIGHHAYEHQLTEIRRPNEELQADEFMGFVLGQANFLPNNIRLELDSTLFRNSHEKNSRLSATFEGYRKAQEGLATSALPFDNDPAWEAFQKAAFPFPPPPCYQTQELLRTERFQNCKTLGDVGKKISRAFEQMGYPYRFMSIPNQSGTPEGFAVVTQLEQYEVNGSIIGDGRLRWHELPRAESFSLSLEYLKSLLFPRQAHLRVFVVLVTRQSYGAEGKRVSKKVAKAWVQEGLNRLPKTIAQKPFDPGYAVDVLVYEFEVPETNHQATQNCPCFLDARTHLRASGLDFWMR